MAEFRTIDESAFLTAGIKTEHARATLARFDRRQQRLVLRLESGLDLTFDPRRVPGLEAATDDDLAEIVIEGVGGTLHFRRLDADYSVARMLDLFLRPDATGKSAA